MIGVERNGKKLWPDRAEILPSVVSKPINVTAAPIVFGLRGAADCGEYCEVAESNTKSDEVVLRVDPFRWRVPERRRLIE